MKQYASYPAMVIDPAKIYTVTITTNRGVITLQLDAASAPNTVNNFAFLASEKFYDGIVFHRVIPAFMIQSGDPEGTGRGGPGYRFADEFADLTKPGHGECGDPDCDCQRTGSPEDCLHRVVGLE